LLFDLHPVGGGMAAGLACLDTAGDLDGPCKQQQLFGQRSLAGIRVGNDGEGASPFYFVWNAHIQILILAHKALAHTRRLKPASTVPARMNSTPKLRFIQRMRRGVRSIRSIRAARAV